MHPVWGGIEDPWAEECSAQRWDGRGGGGERRQRESALSNISKEEQKALTDWEQ